MKVCQICHSQNGDESYYCTMCGNRLSDEIEPAVYQIPAYQQPVYQQPACDPHDHTAKFDATDIAPNKLYAIAIYLMSLMGMLIAFICARDSAYVQFHLRQNVKFMIVEVLLLLIGSVLFFTIIIPIAAVVCLVIVEILRIIAFFQVCNGKAKEPAIIRSLGFLK